MISSKRLYADRVETCIEIWSLILEGSVKSREEVRALLKEYYTERSIEPIRGKSRIELFDKELITLYIVGKYGLGVHEEVPNIVRRVFSLEHRCEVAYYRILKGESPRIVMSEVFKSYDSALLFRMLRFVVTLVLLGFDNEENLVMVLKNVAEAFPEYASRFPLFARFYICLKLCEAIALGKIRSPLEKETLKHALCIKLGFNRCAPPDHMIYDVGRSVYKIKEDALKRILSINEALISKD